MSSSRSNGSHQRRAFKIQINVDETNASVWLDETGHTMSSDHLALESDIRIEKNPPKIHKMIKIQHRLSPEELDNLIANLPPDETLPPDAFVLGQNELRRELMDRGIQPKGFFQDDATRLQQEYEREFVETQNDRRLALVERAIAEHEQSAADARQAQERADYADEVAEVGRNAVLASWMRLLESGSATTEVSLVGHQCNSMGARALVRALALRPALLTLNLGRNALDDRAGVAVAAMSRHHQSLRTLVLDENHFGSATCRALADALGTSVALRSLSLADNPLTREANVEGISALAQALARNDTLVHLNLWHTRLGPKVGPWFVATLRENATLVALDYGANDFTSADEHTIQTYLERNQRRHTAQRTTQWNMKQAAKAQAKAEEERNKAELKEREHQQWIEERKAERAGKRRAEEEQRQREKEAAGAHAKAEAERKAREAQAKAEADKKKKKKGKGKKK